ncbi:ADP-ribosylglycohydrolase family protein, partial [Methylicorpusculum sp.]|uniref:ADP-ribosylglycohydrolase family protein n=1 Tax=Methylicorpusculum sp. TaxID=2713644 RepID=UPI002AC8FE9D
MNCFTKFLSLLFLGGSLFSSCMIANETSAWRARYEDSVHASLIAMAVGDAMGRPTEFLSLKQIFTAYPQGIRSFDDFKPTDFWYENGTRRAPYTDDTAMAKLVFQALLLESQAKYDDLEHAMTRMAFDFYQDMHNPKGWAAPERAPGGACLKAVQKLGPAVGFIDRVGAFRPGWWKVGEPNAGGCGSVMRAAPFGLLCAYDPEKAQGWAAQHSLITHGAPLAQAACAAMAVGVALAVQKEKPEIIAQKMVAVARNHDEKTAQMLEQAIAYAEQNKQAKNFTELFELSKPVFEQFQGWAAHEAIAAALYCFLVCPDNVKGAIYLGVHTPGDSDSIACMAGALVGARVGM